MQKRINIGAMAAMAMAGMGLAYGGATLDAPRAEPKPQPRAFNNTIYRRVYYDIGGPKTKAYRHTVKSHQRMVTKKHNQAKHRARVKAKARSR